MVKTDRLGFLTKCKITDFGLSRGTNEKLVAGPDSRGTVEFCAPEMFKEGKVFGLKIDSWALGIIFYQLLFKDMPFKGVDHDDLVYQIQSKELDFVREMHL